PSLRVQLPLRTGARRGWFAHLRPVTRWQVRRNRGTARPPVVPGRPVPSGVQVEADAAASAVRDLCRRSLPSQDDARAARGCGVGRVSPRAALLVPIMLMAPFGLPRDNSAWANPFHMRVVDTKSGEGLGHLRLTSDNGIVCFTKADGSVAWSE